MRKKSIAIGVAAVMMMLPTVSVLAAEFTDGSVIEMNAAGSSGVVFTDTEVISEGSFCAKPIESALRSQSLYDVSVTGTMVRSKVQEFVTLLNEERTALGKPPVQIDQEMMTIAEERAAQGSFLYNHLRPDGSSGFWWSEAAQLCYTSESSPKELLLSWKGSAAHWEGITDKYSTRFGLGIYDQGTGVCSVYAVLHTGREGDGLKPYKGTFADTKETYRFPAASGFVDFDLGDSYLLEPGKSVEVRAAYTSTRNTPEYSVSGFINDTCGVWKSENPAVASIDAEGVVTAHQPGRTQVHFYLNGDPDKAYTASVTVSGETLPVTIKGNYIYRGSERLYGWIQDGAETYYTDSATGQIQTGFVQINGKEYFFVPPFEDEYTIGGTEQSFSVCAMLKEVTLTINGQWYRFAKDGTFEQIETPKPPIQAPKAPALKVRVSGYDTVTLTWKKNVSADGYQIYQYSPSKKKYIWKKTVSKRASQAVFKKLGYGRTEKFRIRTYVKEMDGGRIYGTFGAPLTVKTAPAASKIISVTNKKKRSMTVNWKRSASADGYQVYRYIKRNGRYKQIKNIANGKTLRYTDKKLVSGRTYYYKVRPYRNLGGGKRIYGPYSAPTAKKCR